MVDLFKDEGEAFYGKQYQNASDERKTQLGKAAHWFNKALEFEKANDAVKLNMALKAASKVEAGE